MKTAVNGAVHKTTSFERYAGEQVRLVTEIISMMAGIAAVSVVSSWPPAEDLLSASVHFHGAWEGAMVLECSLPLAAAFASRFMSVRLPDPGAAADDTQDDADSVAAASSSEDIRDALGELANTIAGNFKALLPPGCLLSVPVVQLRRASGSPFQDHNESAVFQTDYGLCCLKLQSC